MKESRNLKNIITACIRLTLLLASPQIQTHPLKKLLPAKSSCLNYYNSQILHLKMQNVWFLGAKILELVRALHLVVSKVGWAQLFL